MDYIKEHIDANYFIEVAYKNDKLMVRFPKAKGEPAERYSYYYENGEIVKKGFRSIAKVKAPKKLLPTFVIHDVSREYLSRNISVKLLAVYNGHDYHSLSPKEFTKIVNLLISKEDEEQSESVANIAKEFLKSRGNYDISGCKDLADCQDTFLHIMHGKYFNE